MSLKIIFFRIFILFICLLPQLTTSNEVQIKTVNFINKVDNLNPKIKIKIYRIQQDRLIDSNFTVRQKLNDPLPTWILNPIESKIKLKNSSHIFAYAYVIENSNSTTQYFFSNGHQLLPNSQIIGASLKCICSNKIRYLAAQERLIFISSINYKEPFLTQSSIDIITQFIQIDHSYIKLNQLEGLIYE